MDQSELHNLRQWFSEYCRSFYSDEPADQKNIVTKEEHTYRVCVNMAEIALHLRLDEHRTALAGAIALFHDVGRFIQYQRYRTFRDSISANHAALGAGVLTQHNVLADLPDRERKLILRAVTLHNVFEIPVGIDEKDLLFVKMVRDADKLDIWRIFIEYYASKEEDRASAVGLGLPDTPDYSPDVMASLFQRQMVHLTALRTLNDFRLLQLAWIFDLNFVRSFQLVIERSIIDGLAATLPKTDDIGEVIDVIRRYVDSKLRDR